MTRVDPAALAEALSDRYRLDRSLAVAEGAAVFAAEDLKHRRQVRIQWVAAADDFQPAGGDEGPVARLQHPHILPVLDAGRFGGGWFFVVPQLEGEPLAARVARAETPLALPEVIRILTDVCEALVHAHAKGLTHGQLGVESVVLSGRHAVVVDFAAALAGAHGGDVMTDLRSIGTLGVRLLQAGGPADGDPLAGRPASDALATVLRRCLGQDPSTQWHSMAEALRALEPLATPSGGSAPATVRRRGRSRRAWAGWAAAIVLGLFVIGMVWPRLSHHMTQPMPVAQRQVTFNGRTVEGVVSPDGKLVAYSVVTPENTNRILVQELAGGEPIEVASGGKISRLSWSGDGSEVRYVLLQDPGAMLRAVSRLGGPSRALFPSSSYAMSMSPDGKRVAWPVASSQRIVMVDLVRQDTSYFDLKEIDFTWIAGLYWSTAGDRLALIAVQQERQRWNLVLLDPATGARQLLTQKNMELGGVAFSADGRTLYYLESVSQLKAIMRLRLTPDGRPDGKPEPIASGLDPGVRRSDVLLPPSISLSSDARRMVMLRRVSRANLLLRPTRDDDPGERKWLTQGTAANWLSRLSPDDTRLAYIRAESGVGKLVVQNLINGEATVLATAAEFLILSWSPDGTRIAATVSTPDSGVAVQVYPVAGGVPQRLLAGQVSSDIAWDSDSTFLVQLPGNRSFLRVNPRTGDTSSVASVPAAEGWSFDPRVSTRGDRLAIYWNRGKQMHGVWSVSLRDTTTLPLIEGTPMAPLRWSPDDRIVYVGEQDFAGGRLRVFAQPASGGAPRLLTTLPPQQQAEDITSDGRMLVVQEHQAQADLWVVGLPGTAN